MPTVSTGCTNQLNRSQPTISWLYSHRLLTLSQATQHCCNDDQQINRKTEILTPVDNETPDFFPTGGMMNIDAIGLYNRRRVLIFTARCTLVQSAVLRSHVVCLSTVCLSVCLSTVLLNFWGYTDRQDLIYSWSERICRQYVDKTY